MTQLSPTDLLQTYDAQLRAEHEFVAEDDVERHGPLWWGVFRGTKGFVTYRDLDGLDARGIDRLVADTLAHYRADPRITRLEWKTRGHDDMPGLHTALVSRGFVRQPDESVMIGEAAALAVDVPVPAGVVIRRVESEDDVRALCACADEAFGEPVPGMADELLHRLALGRDDLELWVAEVDGEFVCTGRLEPVTGTDFAGLWGGATLERWRRRGVYRALTAERARSAVRRGIRLLQSDSTEDSRPILERSGFVKVTTTTPYEWRRSED
ncbi:GNAT family N-acetyltransferase [Arsenicicoccus sp. oral taxon 190]|uniref:GNAT family N-acetyltransferase n=1 Tax=Arsenicicoccus sp. oral taxon 190 TaxID=1658671 RepID=UPI00067A2E78|nr:GNAT family N-acetyltransferase [Arsenicicoccus sp. oral taxon 190]AKT51867.1 acetyltransferase [Arsenicicoccus sp. oral taxon 190]